MHGMSRADLEAMMLDGMIAQLQANAPELAHLSMDDIKQKTSAHEGPERLLDIMLRAGPYGDKFDGEGLTLAQLKQSPHGIDLGPLQPRLPELLATKNKRINIAPDIITADLTRLQAALDKGPGDQLLLIGRRHIRDMNSWLHNLNNYARGKNRCTLLINPQDARRIGLSADGMARITSKVGAGEAEVTITDSIMPGVVSLPHGFGHTYKDTQQSVASSKTPGISANDLVDDNEMDVALRHQRGKRRAGDCDACLRYYSYTSTSTAVRADPRTPVQPPTRRRGVLPLPSSLLPALPALRPSALHVPRARFPSAPHVLLAQSPCGPHALPWQHHPPPLAGHGRCAQQALLRPVRWYLRLAWRLLQVAGCSTLWACEGLAETLATAVPSPPAIIVRPTSFPVFSSHSRE